MTSPEPTLRSESTQPPAAAPTTNGGARRAPAEGADEAGQWEAVLARLAERGAEILGQVRRLLGLRAEESRLRWRRARWALAEVLLVGAAAATLTVAGGVYLARGLARTLAASLPGTPWLGELLAGALLLALVAGGLALARARAERGELERLRKKHESDGETHGHDGETAADESRPHTAHGADGRGVPGGRAGAHEGRAEP